MGVRAGAVVEGCVICYDVDDGVWETGDWVMGREKVSSVRHEYEYGCAMRVMLMLGVGRQRHVDNRGTGVGKCTDLNRERARMIDRHS